MSLFVLICSIAKTLERYQKCSFTSQNDNDNVNEHETQVCICIYILILNFVMVF